MSLTLKTSYLLIWFRQMSNNIFQSPRGLLTTNKYMIQRKQITTASVGYLLSGPLPIKYEMFQVLDKLGVMRIL